MRTSLSAAQLQQCLTGLLLRTCARILVFLFLYRSAAFGGGQAFYPVKTDIQGNIDKLKKHFLANPIAFGTMQKMVQSEMDAGTTTKSGSATDALMWLKRALHFITEFLGSIGKGEKNLGNAANQAYAASLAEHHGWMVRQVFNVAMMAVPSYEGFMKAARKDSSDDDATMIAQINVLVTSFGGLLSAMDDFYTASGLPN